MLIPTRRSISLVVLGLFCSSVFAIAQAAAPAELTEAQRAASSRLFFEPNRGQAEASYLFLARARGLTVGLDATGAVMGTDEMTVRMQIAGANSEARIHGVDPLPGRVNYLMGSDQSKWQQNVPTYERVRYDGILPNVDLVYRGSDGFLEYDFIVHPGAVPDAIRLAFEGADRVEINDDGRLAIHKGPHRLYHRAPVIFQNDDDGRSPVSGRFVVHEDGTVGFDVDDYDRTRPLVIDPVAFRYSTFHGGAVGDSVNGLAVDSVGAVYLTGSTSSTDLWTTPGAFQSWAPMSLNAFVAKLSPHGDLLFRTYLGGGSADAGWAIAVDDSREIYVVGETASSDFPTSIGAFDTTHNGDDDGFVVKLNRVGSGLVFSSLLGGPGRDIIRDVAIDDLNDIYVTGSTDTSQFPIVGGFQSTFGGGASDVFVTKIFRDGASLVYSSFLGGSSNEIPFSIVVDSARRAVVGGRTLSSDFPVTAGAYQVVPFVAPTSHDGFVVHVKETGASLEFGTFLGGSGNEQATHVALDGANNVYAAVTTESAGLSTTPDAVNPTFIGGRDVYLAKLSPNGSTLLYGTYLGATGFDSGEGLAVSSGGWTYVVGNTQDVSFPLVDPLGDYCTGSDGFLIALNPGDADPMVSTCLGGEVSLDASSATGVDTILDVEIGRGVYVGGSTYAPDFPTLNPFQPTGGLGPSLNDGFVSHISFFTFLTVDPSVMQWTLVPDAIGYDLLYGDLDDLISSGGDFTATFMQCLGDDMPGMQFQHPDLPMPGNAFWYLVRPEYDVGHGTYDARLDLQAQSRDDGIEANPSSCNACPHEKCEEGAALDPGCDECVADICEQDAYCCDTAWDSLCVQEVRTICGSLVCPESQGSCSHTLCTTGAPLPRGCDSPPAATSCTAAVAAYEEECDFIAWDENCINLVHTECNMNCD